VANRLDFSLAEAAVWRPPCLPTPWQPATLTQGLESLAVAAHAWPPRDGLHELIPGLAAPWIWGQRSQNPHARLALAGIHPLRRWLDASLAEGAAASVPSPFPQAEILIGLGPGLTPSGDDFLGGVLVALRALGFPILAERFAAEILPRARERTHAISYAHLAAAAGGEGSAALHEALVGLLTPGSPDLSMRLRALDAIGHTSGWDALAGAALALAVIAESRGGRSTAKAPPDSGDAKDANNDAVASPFPRGPAASGG